MPTQGQVLSVVRFVVLSICSSLATRGYIDKSLVEPIIGVTGAIITLLWSLKAHGVKGTVLAATDLHPELKLVVPRRVMAEDKELRELAHDEKYPQVVPAPIVADGLGHPSSTTIGGAPWQS